MKIKKIIYLLFLLIGASSFRVFAQQDPKASDARKDIAESKANLIEAKKDSAFDYKLFKEESEYKIGQNELMIKQLKAQKISSKKEITAKYDKALTKLRDKNNSLRNKLANDKNSPSAKRWRLFKFKFDRDMQTLNKSIDEIGKSNQ